MEENPKKEEKLEPETEEETKESKEKELEELREVIKKLEQMSKEQKPNRKRRNIIAIEFGGVYHPNPIVNFVFNFILTFTLAFFIVEIFDFIQYREILLFAGLILSFNILEEFAKNIMIMRYFKVILRTFGTVFYFVYVLIFYLLDQYIFVGAINFTNGITLPFFVLFLSVIRYVLGQVIRNFLRYQSMR